jgi:peptide/nickel transport system permease protein
MTDTLPTDAAASSPKSWWSSRTVQGLRRNRAALAGALLIFAFLLVALSAPLLAPPRGQCLADLGATQASSVANPFAAPFWRSVFAPSSCFQTPRLDFSEKPTPPRAEAPLGTASGYDLWYGLVWGTRTAFYLSLIVVTFSAAIGATVGSVAGYFGGTVDNLFMRFTEIVFAFPGLVLNIVLVTLLGRSLENIALAFVLTGWAGYARLVRGEVMRVRTLEFIEGARALGARHPRVLLRHVLPNALTAFVAIMMLDMGSVVLAVSGLSFLGLGTPDGYADWGQIIGFGRAWVTTLEYWYVIVFPGVTVVLWGLGWTLFGEGVRTAFAPRGR